MRQWQFRLVDLDPGLDRQYKNRLSINNQLSLESQSGLEPGAMQAGHDIHICS